MEEELRANLKEMKEEFRLFISEVMKMRQMQKREEKGRKDPSLSATVYSVLYYDKYMAEKSSDDMCENLLKKYSI